MSYSLRFLTFLWHSLARSCSHGSGLFYLFYTSVLIGTDIFL
nr:MAG TPA: hypothetical protein [Caudoviricetes sp.]